MVTHDAILLGGGLGSRYTEGGRKSTLPKQFEALRGKPVFIHALEGLISLQCLRQIIVTAPESHLELAHDLIEKHLGKQPPVKIRVIPGGRTRQESSRLALEALDDSAPTRVLIHDACRPYLSENLLAAVKNCLWDRAYGAWVPVVPVTETLKKIEKQEVVETVDRSLFQRVQTPQVFEYTVIRSLMERAKNAPELNFTDDASLCEYYGIPVGVFEGDIRNIKLTYDFELETLRQLLCAPESDTTSTV
jgi:2-C-methyl-D-erythritol 4-phosphate cytidylyltransferase / 2-C-methyl-D-erythritol 2,4-cyclodiphosphate synthase